MTDLPIPPGHVTTVLVVDDEMHHREILTWLLQAEGWQVQTAEDGEAALAAVAAAPPDVILLDVMMPGLDGLETCRRLKAAPQTVFIPVVLLTALRGTKDRIRGAAAGADEFISKPFDEVELTTRVRSLLRAKFLHDQIQLYNQELEHRVAERTAALEQAVRDLQELDRLKSEFIANVSHELRTPLAHVKGYVNLLIDNALGPLTPEQRHSVQVAQTGIQRLEHIVADVLDFTETTRPCPPLSPVSLVEVCHLLAEECAPDLTRRRISLTLAFPADLPLVLANRISLSRSLRHLLENAVKFSPPGGQVQISAERHGAQVSIMVADHGQGIAADQLDRIFEAFHQVDGSSTRGANGLGIGLTLVKKLIEAQGSHVKVESVPGEGSRFYFDLAVAEPIDALDALSTGLAG